jgi:nitric oxide reductase NorD protein
LQKQLAKLVTEQQRRLQQQDQEEKKKARIQLKPSESDNEQNKGNVQLEIDGQPIAPHADIDGLLTSIMQDLSEIPEEYLMPAGSGGYSPPTGEEDKNMWEGTYHEKGAHIYSEWDFKRQHYRKNWCVLRESTVNPSHTSFVDRTLSRHKGLIKHIRRSFEVLRGEDKLLKKQPYGDDVDIDALVEAYGDVSVGLEMTDNLFIKKHKLDRNIAVMFMVDMSGSTKGWINDAERESLILLCEALEILGDRYAIYGFSGMTRKRCELYRIKEFDEPYNNEVKARICGVEPKDYTRMGVIIRHLSKLLEGVEARTKLLITLSDGKPDDFDGYRGEYGIEDTRMALIEAKRKGIHPFCITIDTEASDYLPHMYGAVNYTVIDEVRKLPLKVSDIYRRLTT